MTRKLSCSHLTPYLNMHNTKSKFALDNSLSFINRSRQFKYKFTYTLDCSGTS